MMSSTTSKPKTTTPPLFKCPTPNNNGVYADPADCTHYYVCTNGVATNQVNLNCFYTSTNSFESFLNVYIDYRHADLYYPFSTQIWPGAAYRFLYRAASLASKHKSICYNCNDNFYLQKNKINVIH